MGKITPAPFSIVVDTREQTPWDFECITKRVRGKDVPLVIETRRSKLDQGDYSILGHEDAITIERKSKADLWSTISQGRKRFKRELQRMQEMESWSGQPGIAFVIVESELSDLLGNPPPQTSYNPKSLLGSMLSWMREFNRVHWLYLPGKVAAQKVAYRIFDQYHSKLVKVTDVS